MINAEDALLRLKEGNERFYTGKATNVATNADSRQGLVNAQTPFAVVLGCSDSRLPVELVFDQGLGDLFVIRVAGNVATPTQIGSVEFAAEKFGTGLVVVLGHSKCGAVQATLEYLKQGTANLSPHLQAIVDLISPGVMPLIDRAASQAEDELLNSAVRANIDAASDKLCSESEILNTRVQQRQLTIVGAEYDLQSGIVEFFT